MNADSLRTEVRQIADEAVEIAHAWMVSVAPPRAEIEADLRALLGGYVSSAALIAADWYQDLDPGSSFVAAIDDDLADEKIVNVARWVRNGPQTPESRIRLATQRLVFDAARRTVFVNAEREGVAIGRDEEADPCNECIARATTWTIERNGLSHTADQLFHPGCEGLFVPARREPFEPPEHASKWRERQWAAIRAGHTYPADIAKWLGSN